LTKNDALKLMAAFQSITEELKDKDIALKDKDIAFIELSSEKTIALKDKDIIIVEIMKEKDITIAAQANQIGSLERVILESKSACTSRGIFEFALKASQAELQLKGVFNAKTVCEEIAKRKSKYLQNV